MTYQPPTPPPTPPARSGGFDPKTVNPLDWGIIGAGILAFIFSFISYYTIEVNFGSLGGGSVSDSVSAWHGFFGWFAALAAVVGSAVIASALFAPQVRLPFAARLIGLIAFAVATLCVILALFVIPDGGAGDLSGVDTGHGLGYWVSLVVIIAGLVLTLMRFQATGGQLPGGLQGKVPNIGGYGPQDGAAAAPGVQGAGYTPPGAPPAAPPAPPAPPVPPRPAPPTGEAPPPPPPGYTPPGQ